MSRFMQVFRDQIVVLVVQHLRMIAGIVVQRLAMGVHAREHRCIGEGQAKLPDFRAHGQEIGGAVGSKIGDD